MLKFYRLPATYLLGVFFLCGGVYIFQSYKNYFWLDGIIEKLDIKQQDFWYFLPDHKFIYFPNSENVTPKKMHKHIKLMGENGFLKGEINFGENAGWVKKKGWIARSCI